MGCLLQEKPALESHYLTHDACWVFWCLHNLPNSDMDYRTFNMHTELNARSCTRGCTDTIRESALKVDSGRKIPCGTGELNLRQQCARPVLSQLSDIPTQGGVEQVLY